tara:strand:+ start:96 stop:386 length:291 start_codon:yes stop_codon:yes gene_type:complete
MKKSTLTRIIREEVSKLSKKTIKENTLGGKTLGQSGNLELQYFEGGLAVMDLQSNEVIQIHDKKLSEEELEDGASFMTSFKLFGVHMYVYSLNASA